MNPNETGEMMHFIRNLRVDKSFIGADAIHPDGTISNVNIEEVPIKQAMIQAANQTILLSDSTKFGTTAFAKVCELSDLSAIITDQGVPEAFLQYCDEKNINILAT